MKFIILESYYMSKDRVILKQPKRCSKTSTLGYLLKISTFNENDDILVLREDTDSIQIRPKAIYKNDKGYYIKKDNKRIYLGVIEVEEIKHAINKFKEIL